MDCIGTDLERFWLFWSVYSTDLDDIVDDDIRVIGISMIVEVLIFTVSDINISNVRISIGVRDVEI